VVAESVASTSLQRLVVKISERFRLAPRPVDWPGKPWKEVWQPGVVNPDQKQRFLAV